MNHLRTLGQSSALRSLVLRTNSNLNLKVRALSSVDSKSPSNADEEIHTGQQWAEDDIRQVRFLNQPKQTNTRWAIDLIKEVPPKEIEGKRVVSCDGGGGALGHPRVYINLDSHEPVSCIYCGLRYVLKEH